MDNIVDIRQNALHRGVPIIRPQSQQFLIDKIKQQNPKHILEIGTAVGYSAICMLLASGADIITIENNPKLCQEAKANIEALGLTGRANVVCKDCVSEVAFMVAEDKYIEHFDFIFLDGPKAQYQNMIDGLIMLLAPNGTIVIDDVLFRGFVEGSTKAPTSRFRTISKRLKTFIDNFLSRPDLFNAKLVDIEDGLLVARKK